MFHQNPLAEVKILKILIKPVEKSLKIYQFSVEVPDYAFGIRYEMEWGG